MSREIRSPNRVALLVSPLRDRSGVALMSTVGTFALISLPFSFGFNACFLLVIFTVASELWNLVYWRLISLHKDLSFYFFIYSALYLLQYSYQIVNVKTNPCQSTRCSQGASYTSWFQCHLHIFLPPVNRIITKSHQGFARLSSLFRAPLPV